MTRRSRTQPPATEAEVTIDVGEIARAAEKSFADADADRVDTLNDLIALRTARSYVLRREREDLAAIAGENTDDVKALDRSLTEATAAVKTFRAQADLAAKPMPTAKADEILVHGVVRGEDGSGTRGVKLSLSDDAGPIKGATATTDRAGHFEIRHAAGDKPLRRLTLHVADDRHPESIELDPTPGAVRFVALYLEG